MAFFALDFDGVLCDSAGETAASAWKCAFEFWPELLKTEVVPEHIIRKFLTVRPYLETGYQSVLMLRMLLENLPVEAFQNDLQKHYQRLQQENRLDRETLIRAFAESRDRWIRQDLQGWLNSHRFYPGTIQALQHACRRHEVMILTTKQERFARLLLEGQNIQLQEDKIWGLEKKKPKEELLEELTAGHRQPCFFVEDRLETLQRTAERPRLAGVKLYYALWGYGTPAEQQQAGSDLRLTCLELQQFNELLCSSGPPPDSTACRRTSYGCREGKQTCR